MRDWAARGQDPLLDSAPRQVSPGVGRAWLRVGAGFLEFKISSLLWESVVLLYNELPQLLIPDPPHDRGASALRVPGCAQACEQTPPKDSTSFACPRSLGHGPEAQRSLRVREGGSDPCSRSKEPARRAVGSGARRVRDTHRDLCSCSKALVLPPWPGCSREQ